MAIFLRVFFISFEFLIIIISFGVYYFLEEYINIKLSQINFDQDMFKYLIMLPPAVFLWIFNKGNSFLQRDTENQKILVHWGGYTYMKTLFAVGFVYAVISLFMCILSALTYKPSAEYIITFVCGLLILMTVAVSFYFANGKIKDILARYSN